MSASTALIDRMIDEITEGMYEAYPELLDKYGEQGKRKCREDNGHHFRHLETAYQVNNDQIFVDYAIWLNGILVRHGMQPDHLIDNFERIQKVLPGGGLPEELVAAYVRMLDQGIDVLRQA
jgi:hypothetical protein